jgi:hypothetical protein
MKKKSNDGKKFDLGGFLLPPPYRWWFVGGFLLGFFSAIGKTGIFWCLVGGYLDGWIMTLVGLAAIFVLKKIRKN